jgi:methylthioribose-1-phosphate isomerase
MRDRRITTVIAGADRIAANGDTANKIGTYALAVLADYHDAQFFVAAPTSTIDSEIAEGAKIKIEERNDDEILIVESKAVAPPGTPVWNPAFDVTPSSLITAIITERGTFRAPYSFVAVHSTS